MQCFRLARLSTESFSQQPHLPMASRFQNMIFAMEIENEWLEDPSGPFILPI